MHCILYTELLRSLQFSCSVMSDSLWPMDRSMPGLPVQHPLPEFTQTHVIWVGDAILPSHPLSPPSPLALSLSQHQVFSKEAVVSLRWPGVSASASVFPISIQDWFPLGLTGLISLLSKGLSRVLQHHSSKASILHYSAFFIVQLSHPYMTTGKPEFWIDGPLLSK